MKKICALFAVLIFGISISAQKLTTGPVPTSQPTFAAVDMAGQKVDIAALKGKVVVLNLWFVNCPNCLEEIKLLNGLVDQYKDNKDVVFVGLAASKKVNLQQFLQKNPFKYQIIPDATQIILGKFGDPNKSGEVDVPFPMHYVLDRQGNIVVKAQGIKGVDVVKKELVTQFTKKAGGSN